MPETTIFIVVSGPQARANSVCTPQTTTKIVVWGTAPKNKIRRAQPKKSDLRVEISRFAEAHRDVSEKSTFFILLRLTSRNPYFYSVFDTSQSSIVKNALFWKPLKNRDRKKKCIFDIFERIFAGHKTPIFVVFWGCAFSGPSCQKRQFLDTPPPKKKKILTDNWKALFWVFLCFFYIFFLFFCFFVFCYLFFVVFLFLFFVLFVLFGGFKGQMRWPKGPPHLALNPPYFCFCFCFFCSFPFFAFNRKTLFFPLKKAFLFIFCVSLSLSLNLFWLPPFSVSLCLSLSLLLLSFFLPSCLSFLLSFCFLFLSLFHFSFFFAFV